MGTSEPNDALAFPDRCGMEDLSDLRAARHLNLMFGQVFRGRPLDAYFAALMNYTRLCDKASLDWCAARDELLKAVTPDKPPSKPGNWSIDSFLAYYRCIDHMESTVEAADRAINFMERMQSPDGSGRTLDKAHQEAPTPAQRKAICDLRNGIQHRERDILRGGDVSAGPFQIWVSNDRVFVGTWGMPLADLANAIRRLHHVARIVTLEF
jgi:hypothetical protein